MGDHRYREDCGCYCCRLEADSWDADPGYDEWADSLDSYDGSIPADQDDSALKVDVLRAHSQIRKARQPMADSSVRTGARTVVAA